MNLNLPPCFGSIPRLFRNRRALFGGVLVCVAPGLASAQSVTFAGAQTTLPFGGLNYPYDVAVDRLGNLFAADLYNNRVVELPKTSTGYGPQITLPFSGVDFAAEVAVDSAGDVFSASLGGGPVLELPWTGSGYGAQVTLGGSLVAPGGISVDNARNVFVTDNSDPAFIYSAGSVYEWPRNPTGYGSPITLPYGGAYNSLGGPAVDSAGDLFIDDTVYTPQGDGGYSSVSFAVELPKTGTGYGQAIELPTISGFSAVDGAGDVFLLGGKNNDLLQKLPWTGTAYGTLINLAPIGVLEYPSGAAVDSQGNFFIADSGNNRVLELQRRSVNFGSVNFCTSGAPAPCSETLTLDYSVTASGTLGTPKVLTGGAPDLDFTLAKGSTCTGAVTAGSFCTANVTFAPLATGVRNGTVEITDGSGTVLATTTISGFGSSPDVQVSPTYLPFGAVSVGTSDTLPVTVTNTGGGTLTVASSISGSSNFTIAGSTCGTGVTAGNNCALQVQFTPTTVAKHYGQLTVSTNGGSATVSLAGTGGGLSVNEASLPFGMIFDGATKVLPLTVTNVGLPGTVTIRTAITVRSTTHPTTTYEVLTTAQNTCLAGIAAGQSCILPIEFAPTASGSHDDLLTLTPSGGEKLTVTLTGSSTAAPGQTVTFTGLQTTLPFSGLVQPYGITVDRAGDVFTVNSGNGLAELPETPTGYGPQTTLAAGGSGIAVDSVGDLFLAGNPVVELPWTGTSYGPQIALPFSDLSYPEGVAVDSAGDVFVTNSHNGGVYELPKTATGYGPQITLPFSGLDSPWGIAVDRAGNLFVSEVFKGNLLEFPKTPTGYGPRVKLATNLPYPTGSALDIGVAVDHAGDVFVSDGQVVEFQKTSTGFGPPATLPTIGVAVPQGVAVDRAGDVFIDDGQNDSAAHNRVVELQTQPSVYVCAPGQTIPAPCSVTLTLHFNVNDGLTLGTPAVLTGGAPNLDFTLASGSTCTGELTENSACIVNVTFAPLATGVRNGTVEIVDSGGKVLTSAEISATGIAPPTGTPTAHASTDYLPFGTVPLGSSETLPVTIINTGGGTLTIATAFSGSSNFTIAADSCGGAVTPGDSCAVLVKFSPTSIGTHSGLLSVQTNGGNPTVGLKGSAN